MPVMFVDATSETPELTSKGELRPEHHGSMRYEPALIIPATIDFSVVYTSLEDSDSRCACGRRVR
jgi:hypothetical protein